MAIDPTYKQFHPEGPSLGIVKSSEEPYNKGKALDDEEKALARQSYIDIARDWKDGYNINGEPK